MKRIDLLKPYKGMNFKSKLRVTKLLAKVISLVSIIMLSTVFQGCEKEELFFQGDYLDVDMTQEVLSESDLEVYNQAQKRMDEFVEVENNTYTTTLKSGISINISEELFSFFMNKMEESNLLIKQKGFVLSGKTFYTSTSIDQCVDCEIPRLKSTDFPEGDEEVGGVDMVEYMIYWYGIDITLYISNRTLFRTGSLLGVAGIAAGVSPEPAVNKVVGACCGLSTIVAMALVYEYPNGIILKVFSPSLAPTCCIPYSLVSQ